MRQYLFFLSGFTTLFFGFGYREGKKNPEVSHIVHLTAIFTKVAALEDATMWENNTDIFVEANEGPIHYCTALIITYVDIIHGYHKDGCVQALFICQPLETVQQPFRAIKKDLGHHVFLGFDIIGLHL